MKFRNIVALVAVGLLSAFFAVYLDRSQRSVENESVAGVHANAEYTCWSNQPKE